MQGMRLDNNERKETVNGYFANTANGNAIQSSEMWDSEEKICGSLF